MCSSPLESKTGVSLIGAALADAAVEVDADWTAGGLDASLKSPFESPAK